MHPRIEQRIALVSEIKKSEIDNDLKHSLIDLANFFRSAPRLFDDNGEYVEITMHIHRLIQETSVDTQLGLRVRIAAIDFLERINPKLQNLSSCLSEASGVLSDIRDAIREVEDG